MAAAATFIQLGAQLIMGVYGLSMLNNLTDVNWLWKQARRFSFMFDGTLIKLSSKFYDYYVKILNGTIITPEVITDIKGRIYIVIGILIMFKLAVTLIKYMISPETFSDTKTGAGKLVKRIILGCILIAFIPSIFSLGRRVQSAVLEDRFIEKLVLPQEAYEELANANIGNRLTMMVFQGFFNWNDSVPKTGNIYSQYEQIQKYDALDISSYTADINKTYFGSGGSYYIDYMPIISTLAIGFVLYTLLKYTLELAMRMIKLAFLEIVAPFIIVSYMMNPSDDDSLKKWTNAAISTYVIIFVRVLTLWIVGLLVYYLRNPGELPGGATSLVNSTDPLIKTIIIIGAFAFLKDFPKLLSDLTGYNLQENETINGLMQKGVGIVKGFAMAKIGSTIAKDQLAVTGSAQLAGAAGSGMSGATEAKKKGASGWGVFSAAGGGFSQGANSVTSGIRGAMSSASPLPILGSSMGVSGYSGGTDPTSGGKFSIDTKEEQAARKEKRARKREETAISETINALPIIQSDASGKPRYDFSENKQTMILNQINANLKSQGKNGVQYNNGPLQLRENDIQAGKEALQQKRNSDTHSTVPQQNDSLSESELRMVLEGAIAHRKGAKDSVGTQSTSRPVGPTGPIS